MKIAFFEIKGWEISYLKKKLRGHTLKFFKEEKLTLENIDQIKDFDVISIFIYSKINKMILSKLKKLKLITTRSTGFDHIDLKECKKRKILVANVPFYGENTVAEHTFALILSLSRNIHKSYVRTLQNDFSIEGLTGFDIKDKTIGVIGVGHIGLHVIKIARGFGMKVLAYDISRDKFISEVLGFEYVPLDDLLQHSDIITIHTPLNKFTYHLINEKTLKKIKRGAILINTARGAIVDTDALLYALDHGILSGAGIDVIEGEELIKEEKELLHKEKSFNKIRLMYKDHLIFQKENVVFTPHIAFNSREALQRILDTTLENIMCFVDKKNPNYLCP